MKEKPLVTVICICYNHQNYVVEALNSVLNQSYKNIQLIVCDDYSTDNSVTIIKNWLIKHPEIKFIKNNSNIGNNITFNNVLKFAKGDYIIDLAADDYLLPNCIETQLNTFKNSNYKNVGIVYSNIELQYEYKTNKPKLYYLKNSKPQSGNLYHMLISGSEKMCSVGSMVKKEVFNSIGNYDETLAYEDFDFWLRTSRVFNFEYIPKVLAVKRELKTNKTSASFSKKKSLRVYKWHLSTLKILKKAYHFNQTIEEHRALLYGRVRFEQKRHIKSLNPIFFLRYVWFEIKIRTKIFSLKIYTK